MGRRSRNFGVGIFFYRERNGLNMLNVWRDQYENIYKTELCGEEFIWRELTKVEFDKAKRYYTDDGEREEYVCSLCVLKPLNYDYANCPAGIPTTLTRLILAESGFIGDTAKNTLNTFRAELESFDHIVAPVICSAFPKFDLEEVESWTIKKMLKYFSRAEMILAVRGTPLQFSEGNPEPIDDFPELRQEMEAMRKRR
jgi:hypothetical protein